MAVNRLARRIIIRDGDVLIINGYEVDAAILRHIVDPAKRVLWAFVRGRNNRDVQPVPYDEKRVLWLADDDLRRTEQDEVNEV